MTVRDPQARRTVDRWHDEPGWPWRHRADRQLLVALRLEGQAAGIRCAVPSGTSGPRRPPPTNDGADHDATRLVGGLGDLAERLHAAGGTLLWKQTSGQFQVHARLPTPAPTSTSEDTS